MFEQGFIVASVMPLTTMSQPPGEDFIIMLQPHREWKHVEAVVETIVYVELGDLVFSVERWQGPAEHLVSSSALAPLRH